MPAVDGLCAVAEGAMSWSKIGKMVAGVLLLIAAGQILVLGPGEACALAHLWWVWDAFLPLMDLIIIVAALGVGIIGMGFLDWAGQL